ncbi:cation/H+ exchanger domain-containing protein [Pseudoscourfieldia marina]
MKTTTYSFAACTSSSHTTATTTATTANRRRHQKERRRKRQKLTTNNAAAAGAAEAVTSGLEVAQLGRDTMVFLAATVGVVPLCKRINMSPVLGFLLVGFVLDQLHVFQNEEELTLLSELGIQFLLFEMGLELDGERLKSLFKFAFGLGMFQVIATTLAFTAFELPTNNAMGSRILQVVSDASPAMDRPELINISTVDEAVVIGAALSLSSSAFVLQLLSERGALTTAPGAATLGVLLAQDIAVVPMLVLLPLIEGPLKEAVMDGGGGMSVLLQAAPDAAVTMLYFGLIVLAGKFGLKRVFDVVASSRSSEGFIAACLLTVVGASVATKSLGLSDTLGAFLAGVLLAETSYRAQVEADIRPFKGLLLGMFFVTTGTTIDRELLMAEWPMVLTLLFGLIAVKSSIVSFAAPFFGLSRAESVKTGLLLSQGGELAFVLLNEASMLKVLPEDLNKLLIIVVVFSMALTPALDVIGDKLALYISRAEKQSSGSGSRGTAVAFAGDTDGTLEAEDGLLFGPLADSPVEGSTYDEDVAVATAAAEAEAKMAASPSSSILLDSRIYETALDVVVLVGDRTSQTQDSEKFNELLWSCGLLRSDGSLASYDETRPNTLMFYDDGDPNAWAEPFSLVNTEDAVEVPERGLQERDSGAFERKAPGLCMSMPRAFIILHEDQERSRQSVRRFRASYPTVPIFALVRDGDVDVGGSAALKTAKAILGPTQRNAARASA